MKAIRLKMTSEGRVCLGLADAKRYGVPHFGRSDAESASAKMKGCVRRSIRYTLYSACRIAILIDSLFNRLFD